MKIAIIFVIAALGVAGCASNSNSGTPPSENQISGGQGQQNSSITNNPTDGYNQWRNQGITPTTP